MFNYVHKYNIKIFDILKPYYIIMMLSLNLNDNYYKVLFIL